MRAHSSEFQPDRYPDVDIQIMSSDIDALARQFLHQALPEEITSTGQNPLQSTRDNIWITLTFAQSLDGKIAGVNGQQLILSGSDSMRMTHW